MKKFSPEIVFSSKNNGKSKQISQQLKAGLLCKIAPKVYTTNLEDAPLEIIYRNRYQIASHLFPGAIISHRTAFEGDVKLGGTLFLTYSYRRNLSLPGLTIQLIKNEFSKEGTSKYLETLYLSGYERTLLENLQPSRQRSGICKTVDRVVVEQRLEMLCQIKGETELNRLRENAKTLAASIGMKPEYEQLNEIMSAILGTHSIEVLKTASARARAQGLPYDTAVLERFMSLNAALRSTVLPIRELTETLPILRNIAFFDAYFSNFIEGTEFDPEEAADIMFNNRLSEYRHEDSHDIIATYNIVSNVTEMCFLPDSPEIFETLLKKRHAILLAARKDKQPGKFKEIINYAGNTKFVLPKLLRGTLAKGFELYRLLDNPFARAAFIMFVVSEVHPFLDGNGRLARIMMNADLVFAGQCRIFIPTVFHEDYLLTLRRLTRGGDAEPYIKMLNKAQEFVSKINFDNYDKAIKMLYASNAFAKHDEGVYLKMP
ncbi:Fic family protein [Candidatus Parabeggiatoa sp. HSG14]|uniref:Fic family protein n=1 Tax=Candidatus Parabeggiatoa sp. HSG14 TaxID=3055593 RepID=UPI0025A768FD|nr:Fic family protein [Thiotrichales bacterium HSG14]